MEKFKNRVYGVVGIKSRFANWNADFTGNPKTTLNGDIFGSDKAFKYPIKAMWNTDSNKKVLYIKSYKKNVKKDEKEKSDEDGKIIIQSKELSERYKELFNKNLKDIKDKEEIVKDLFSAIDVLNFGATFAEEKNNISITGAVQVGQGYNIYKNTNVEVIDILSPFRDPNKENALNSSIGKKIVTDEAHYMYPFVVNPSNYNIYEKLFGDDFVGYTKEAYEEFKKGCLIAATAYNTNSKAGCENEFALFVTCKEDSKLYLANLDQYVIFDKNKDALDTIDISKISEILDKYIDQIESVEVYYNKYTTKIEGVRNNYIIKALF